MQTPIAVTVTVETFQTEVVDRSQSMPVVVLFWAEQVPPSVQTKALLETLLDQYAGKFALALSDVATDQNLAQRLQVPGLPCIRVVHKGQIVDQLDGPAEEQQLRASKKSMLSIMSSSNWRCFRFVLAAICEVISAA